MAVFHLVKREIDYKTICAKYKFSKFMNNKEKGKVFYTNSTLSVKGSLF